MPTESLEVVRLRPAHRDALVEFFEVITLHRLDEVFHPHPFTKDEAGRLAAYAGRDLYYVMISANEIIGYAMLRGWDEGFEVPSLGIVIHPKTQGKGLGRLFILFLHASARLNGAKKMRLTVNRQNTKAQRLYESFGYRFEEYSDSSLVGWLDLE